MNFDKLKEQSIKDENTFVKNFGYYLMTVSREDLPILIDIALATKNNLLKKKIFNNIPFLLKKVRIRELGHLLNVLFQEPAYYNEIVKNFDYLSDFFAPNNIESTINAFLSVNKFSKIIADNFETFLENTRTPEQVEKIVKSTKHIQKCNEKFKLYKSILPTLGEFSFLEKLNPGTMLKLINNNQLGYIKSIFIKYSYGDLSKVRFLDNGFTSSVFLADSQIIKIGKKRIAFNVPFSKYVLQPYLRQELRDSKNNVFATIEVQDYCSTKDITDEEATKFINMVNNSDIAWLDANKGNVFRLLRTNTRKLLPLEDGFYHSMDEDTTLYGQAGDLIIGDTDFIYSKEDAAKREDGYRTPSYEKTFSLILPTYNMEKHLANCLNSILNQTCNNFEVIIINDGSLDKSREIAEQYAAIDSRFKIFDFPNGGLSTARNRGLKLANGKYIMFIDPDDSIEPELLEKLEPYVKHNIETIRFGAIVQNEMPKKDPYRFNRPFYPTITSGIEALKLWNDDKRYATAWLYCIKKDVYDRCNFKFPIVRIYEDVASIPKLIANSKSVAMLDYIGYDYIQHDSSITNSKKTNKALYDLTGFMQAYDLINDSMSEFFSRNPNNCSIETVNEILDGFFIRLENKFKHTNALDKDLYARDLFTRNRLFDLDYKPQQYFKGSSNGLDGNAIYSAVKTSPIVTYDDTSISKVGEFTFNINGRIDKANLYRVEKSGNYNFTDSFLCISDMDFDSLLSNPDYKEMAFKYLLSYTNLFLAESLNGGYIGSIDESDNKLSINFDPYCTEFARYWRNNVAKLNDKSNYQER